MQQLSGMDAMFVHQESTRTPMHITSVLIYDPATAPQKPIRFKEILQAFEYNLHKTPVFRRKLVAVPWNLDNPYWIEDSTFDLEYHVRHVALPKPGDWRQFCILMARLHARGLDMSRPLWEAYVIEGLGSIPNLPDGAFAIMLKIHHSAIDGVSGAEIINVIHTSEPVMPSPPESDNWQGEPEPSGFNLARVGYLGNMMRPVKLATLLTRLVRQQLSERDTGPGAHLNSRARTRFNGKVGAHRVCDGVRLDLAEVKAIKNAIGGVTLNDVVVAIIGGALREYLLEKEELPLESLGAAAPISVRGKDEMESGGNLISAMTLSLRTDIADPIERVQAVNEAAIKAKAYSNALGARTISNLVNNLSTPIGALGARAISAATMLEELPVSAHTVVSNVPGPQQDLFMCGARLHSFQGIGPLLDNMGLFHVVFSISGGLSITFVSCRDMLLDPQRYRECLQNSFDQLKAAALKPARRKTTKRKKQPEKNHGERRSSTRQAP